jgi:hypothetical protein
MLQLIYFKNGNAIAFLLLFFVYHIELTLLFGTSHPREKNDRLISAGNVELTNI